MNPESNQCACECFCHCAEMVAYLLRQHERECLREYLEEQHTFMGRRRTLRRDYLALQGLLPPASPNNTLGKDAIRRLFSRYEKHPSVQTASP